jgi:hypothetical protein
MTDIVQQTKRLSRTITWVNEKPLIPCEHQYEIVVHADPSAPKRCAKCGDREAK